MIYKPTDLSPSAQTFDVKDTPIFFECKVDTSNVQARGFTIKILDSENNVVFSSIPEGEALDIKYITLIDDLAAYISNKFPNYTTGYNLLNTGYNGTYLKIPFSVAIDDAAKSTVGINQIFYSETQPAGASELSPSGLYKYTQNALETKTYNAFEPIGIYNGQEYKWSITLYQLEDTTLDSRTSSWDLPNNPLYYDMPLTTGTVLGSTNERIQSAFSEEIYSDYFIQPVHIDNLKFNRDDPSDWTGTNLTQIGSRVLIKSYDPTYGFIYPVTGDDGIPQQDILQDGTRANAFQIYKRGNNRDNLTAYQQAALVTWGAIDIATSSTDSYHVGDIISINPSSSDDESEGLSFRCVSNGAHASETGDTTKWQRVQYRTWSWTQSLAEPGESYGTETWYTTSAPNGNYTPPGVLCEYDSNGTPMNGIVNTSGLLPAINSVGLIGNERIVLNSQRSEAQYNTNDYIGSPFNGLFYPQFTASQQYKKLTYVPKNSGTTPPTITIYSLGSLLSFFDNNGGDKQLMYSGDGVWTNGSTAGNLTSIGIQITTQGFTPSTGDSITVSLYYKNTARWLRTPDADSWGELATKTVMITESGSEFYGQNIQTAYNIGEGATAYGTINETPFKFIEEQPINIYTDSDYSGNNPYYFNTGLIFYNNALGTVDPISSGDSTEGVLYIRHFDGLSNGMLLFKTSTNNIQQYVKIKQWNPQYNFIVYDKLYTFNTYQAYNVASNPTFSSVEDTEWVSADSVGSGTKYQIKTFFRESDENAFYFYTTPVVGVHYSNALGVDFVEDRRLTEKYYSDYVNNILPYSSEDSYSSGDVVSYGNPVGYYKCISTDWTSALPTNTTYWQEDDSWTNNNAHTTEYNKYFDYNKDDIVSYDNKNDFLLYNPDRTYNYGDKVVYNSQYYISLKDNNSDDPPSVKWDSVDFSSSDDTKIKYVALTNAPAGTAPSGDNIGLYWQQYIGVLFENEGYVSYKRYNNNIIYDVGDIILDKGLYYYVNRLNESYTSSLDPNHINEELENSRGSLIWEKYKTDIANLQLVGGELLYGPYNSDSSFEGEAGLLYLYNSENREWEKYNSGAEKYNDYYYTDGIAYLSEGAINKATTFDKSTVYAQTQTVFDEGILYTCIAATSGHTTNDEEYFVRNDKGQPFGYPISANGRKNASDESKDYKMSNIVLGRGNADNALPDRYYVKINNNTDASQYSSSSNTEFIPDPSNWEIYYGPMYVGKDYSSSEEGYEYNSVIYEEKYGLYFIKQNIDTSYDDKGPIITAQSYSAVKSYNEGDIVLYNNQFFICKQSGSGRPDIKSQVWDLYPWQIFIPEITERTLVVSADYKQQEYIQWKSAQWFLYDANGTDIIDKSDVFYDGDLKYTFHGLDGREANKQQNKYFIIRLILETYNGYRLTLDNTIEVMFTITEIDAEGLIDLSFDCDTTAVKTTVTKETGFIIPNLTAGSEVSYDASTVNSDVDGSMTLTGQMDYEKVAVSIENAGSISSAKYIISAAERLMLQAATRIQGEKFQGNLFALYSSNETTGKSTQVGSFEIFVPEFLVDDVNDSINDEVLRNETRIQLNNDRNKIMWRQKEPSGELVEGNVVLYQSAVDGEPAEIVSNYLISEEGSFDTGYFFGGDNVLRYKTVPMWQNSGFNTSSYDLTNYLPITNETVVIANNGNIIVNTTNYRNISMEYSEDVGYNIADGTVVDDNHIPDSIHIKKILEPGIDASMFVASSEEEGSTKFVSAVLETQDSSEGGESDSRDTIYIRAKTSAHWSDYQAEAPLATLVGRKNIQGTQTDYYTQKNVFTKFGWVWDDSDDNNMWSDGDYVESYTGYNSCLGEIRLNGKIIERYNFADGSFDASFDNSDTFFTSQTKISSPILKEREVLNNIILTVDMDLSMDADGYITLTPDEITQEEGILIKPVVYVKRDSSTEE